MVVVSDDLKSAFLAGTQKDITLTFSDGTVLDNSAVVLESMTIDQVLCGESQLKFGCCASSKFKISIFNAGKPYKDLNVSVTLTAYDEEDTAYPFSLGTYKIDKDTVSDDRSKRELIGYDALYPVMNADYSDWYQGLTLPMTVKEFRDAFFTEIGITQEVTTLVNDNVAVTKTVAGTLSGSKILSAIMEMNGVDGFVDYSGTFRYVGNWSSSYGLYPAEDLYPSEDLYPKAPSVDATFGGSSDESGIVLGSLVYEDYYYMDITGVKIVEDSDDDGTFVGTDGNSYLISGNFLLYGASTAVRTQVGRAFLNNVSGFFYKPLKFKARSHPWMELGDYIKVVNERHSFTMPILERHISGITAIYDQYQAKGKEYYTYNANNLTNMVEQLSSRTIKITQNLDEVSSTLTEKINDTAEELESKIEQTIDGISMSVTSSKGGNAVISVTLDDGEGTSKTATANIQSSDVINVIAEHELNLTSNTININSTHFQVGSDGTVTATNGSFSGYINASSGYISGALTVSGSLTGGSCVLNSSGISINGCSLAGYGANGIVCANYFAAERFVSKTDMSGSIQNAECIVSAGNSISAFWYDSNDPGYIWCRINVPGYGWGNYKIQLA